MVGLRKISFYMEGRTYEWTILSEPNFLAYGAVCSRLAHARDAQLV